MAEKRTGSLPVMGESAEKYLLQLALAMNKQGLPVEREMIIHKASEIQRYMFGSMHSVGLFGRGWCDQFMSQNGELTLRTAQVIKRERKKACL